MFNPRTYGTKEFMTDVIAWANDIEKRLLPERYSTVNKTDQQGVENQIKAVKESDNSYSIYVYSPDKNWVKIANSNTLTP